VTPFDYRRPRCAAGANRVFGNSVAARLPEARWRWCRPGLIADNFAVLAPALAQRAADVLWRRGVAKTRLRPASHSGRTMKDQARDREAGDREARDREGDDGRAIERRKSRAACLGDGERTECRSRSTDRRTTRSVRMPEPAAIDAHEFTLSRDEFERARAMIRARAGIALNDSKRNMVYSRLAGQLRAYGLGSFTSYLDRVERESALEQGFVNALTTNLTSFFREAHHFPLLADYLRSVASSAGRLEIWCCAASTGEEPFSIAMTAIDVFGGRSPVRVIATDVDTQVLKTADRAVYRAESIARLDPDVVQRHFLRGTGSREGFVRIRPEVRDLVTFRPVNLLSPHWGVGGPLAAIFCRNVMIYFDKPTQRRLLERFAPLLSPSGLLFAGHSENFTRSSDLFRLRGKTVYERASSATENRR
jgi:chemotaxis protein methyltransferase CheR